MKKIIAIVLAAILSLTLVACANSDNKMSGSPSAATSSSPSADATPDVSDDAAPEESASLSEKSTFGYFTDDVDYFNRDPYRFAIMMMTTSTAFVQTINDSFTDWGTVMNYEPLVYDANNDYDGYMNEMQVLAGQGYDGLLCGMDSSMVDRVYELVQELGIPGVGMLTAFSDEDQHVIWPSVTQDEYNNGATCMQWLADNYTNYWNDEVDLAKIGLITVDFSPVVSIHARIAGMYDVFVKAFPDSAENYFVADLVTNSNGFSQFGATDMTSSIISVNPEIEKWFVIGAVDDFAVGAARAVEALDKTDSVLVVSDQADAFFTEIESGSTDSCYVGACAISAVEMTGYGSAALCAIVDGRATPETLWPDYLSAGDEYPCILIQGVMLTKDTYLDWQQTNSFEAMSAGMKAGKQTKLGLLLDGIRQCSRQREVIEFYFTLSIVKKVFIRTSTWLSNAYCTFVLSIVTVILLSIYLATFWLHQHNIMCTPCQGQFGFLAFQSERY